MAKGETRETYKAVKNDQAATDNRYAQAQGQAAGQTSAASGQASSSRDALSAAISGIDTSKFQDIIANGGYDDGRRASIMDNVSGLKTFGRLGASDETSANRIRGLGVYDEFAQTGGVSERDKANIRANALAPISSLYSSTKDEIDRRKNVQGGYSFGADAASRSARREAGRGMVDASVGAELGISDRVREGRLIGAEGASRTEGTISNNQMTGLGMAGDMEMRMQDSINHYRMQGASLEQAAQLARADIANSISSRDDAASQNALNREYGLLNDRTNANLGYYGARDPLARQPGIGGNIMQGIGVGTQIAANAWNGDK